MKQTMKAINKVDGAADAAIQDGLGWLLDKLPARFKTIIGSVVFGLAIAGDAIITHFALFQATQIDEWVLNTALSLGGSLAGLGLMHKLRKSKPKEQ